ncbi:MAG TPA: hypothetical protein DCE44_08750 [Verrucomicrobiales bacterium]|nr:hypothetical protein [Verrucomicrobiales bacterium]
MFTTTVASARAEEAKTYQVTGPVIELTDSTITVQKDTDKWQIARSKGTKGIADVKVGDKVTIYYRMVATEVEVKSNAAAKPAKKDK